jgi:V/A-type H+-transporting ATPase subunit C
MANLLTRMFGGGGAGNYAYVTARVRAKKTQLLTPDQYPKLLAREASEIARALQEGQYKAEIDELASRHRGADLVERATRLNLGRTYAQVLGFATGELAVTIAAYLGRYDVYNIKTVLRGKFSRSKPEDILDETVPAGSLAPRLPELARLERVEDVVDALRGTPWHRVLAKTIEGRQLSNLIEVENELDKAYYETLLASIPSGGNANKAFVGWIRNEIDVMNLKTLFRLRFARVTEWEPYFLPGGVDVSRESAARIARGSDEEVVAEVGQLDVDASVVDATRSSLASGNMNAIATALEKELIRDARDFSHRAPLSVLPVVDFILHKKIEADNLRAIAYGKQTGLPTQTIEELLIL